VKIYNLTKKDISINISKRIGLSYSFSSLILEDFIETLIQEICNNKLILKNIGSFKIIKKRSRIGRNPKTKQEYMINERNTLSFKSSNKLLEILNLN
tara:strand:- start:81 stop:371 length:291 start_codon:yes stop_codon:yes gene_type:complete